MSIQATRWAYKQKVGRSSAKFILVTLADFVNHTENNFESWATIECISNKTELNRKTVILGIKLLLERGFIVHTGRYIGKYNNCPIYKLTYKAQLELGWVEQSDGQHAMQNMQQSCGDADYAHPHNNGHAIPQQPPAHPIGVTPPSTLTDRPAWQETSNMASSGKERDKAAADQQRAALITRPVVQSKRSGPPPKAQGQVQPIATRLPDEWRLPKDWERWAQENRPNWMPQEIAAVAAIFHAYYLSAVGARGMSTDWYASWRLWVLRETHVGQSHQPPSRPSNASQPVSDEHDRLRRLAQKVGVGEAWPGETTSAYRDRISNAGHSQRATASHPVQ